MSLAMNSGSTRCDDVDGSERPAKNVRQEEAAADAATLRMRVTYVKAASRSRFGPAIATLSMISVNARFQVKTRPFTTGNTLSLSRLLSRSGTALDSRGG